MKASEFMKSQKKWHSFGVFEKQYKKAFLGQLSQKESAAIFYSIYDMFSQYHAVTKSRNIHSPKIQNLIKTHAVWNKVK